MSDSVQPPLRESFIVLKPDALARNLQEYIHGALHIRGLRVNAKIPIVPTEDALAELYSVNDRSILGPGTMNKIWLATCQYLVGNPCELWIVEGDDVVRRVDDTKVAMRGTFAAADPKGNLVHAPDNDSEVSREMDILLGLSTSKSPLHYASRSAAPHKSSAVALV